jgi:hypothetical protein
MNRKRVNIQLPSEGRRVKFQLPLTAEATVPPRGLAAHPDHQRYRPAG